ncbi:hypothetical protein [Prescottella equi]|uniref:Putative DNA-binding protein n=1 Tax=Rhodococcus hoagii TaxID=43767 RepID=A0A0F6WFS6_RHOHA|nr:hypothetical protein [Prescottella equi]AKF16010.1 putative DNA-binding protein [Prescottella equi]AKG90510.1 putative DNA-binding protein [Prescottella equi]ARX59657.1 putative DNA-binding protein [Prescottella equi]ARX59800.1 putative DNA-binding protein [Prescottella equi]ARX59947.1 putative DNA-binding protein [Prescottella equi]
MSGIPEPSRPAPRSSRRNVFAQAAESSKTEAEAPATTQQPAATPAPVAQQSDATPAPVAQRPAAPATRRKRREDKRKAETTDILLSLDVDLKERMVATLEHTRPRTGITSQQMFIRVAIEQLCARLEADYNRGEAFPQPAEDITL